MFTNATIRLSEIGKSAGINVVRDCDIANVGKIPTRLPDRLVYAGQAKHLSELDGVEGIAGIVVPTEIADLVPPHLGLAIAVNPAAAAISVFEALIAKPDLHWQNFPSRISGTAIIHPSAIIEPNNVIIGERTRVDAGAVIRERSIIGDDCYIGAQVCVAADAFEVAPGIVRRLMPQAGGVRIGDRVTLLAGTKVTRSTFGGFTELEDGVMTDNLVHIAHDCSIGENSTLTACTEISGRVTVGAGSYFGPNCTISNGVTLGRGAYITIGSVVVRDVADDERVTGNFAVPHRQWIRFIKSLSKAD